jgi:hypothetical protein
MTERYLPKWAQEQMNAQKREIRQLKERVRELEDTFSGDGKSMFYMTAMGSVKRIGLPSSVEHMKVEMPNGFEIDIQPASGGNGGIGTKDTIQIMVVSHHGLAIQPQASNVIHIGPRIP